MNWCGYVRRWTALFSLLPLMLPCEGSATDPGCWVVVGGGTSGTGGGCAHTAAVGSIAIAPVTALTAGDSTTVSALTRDAAGNQLAGRSVRWSSSDPKDATIYPSGLLVALKPDNMILKAVAEHRSAAAPVSVAAPTITRLALSPSYRALDRTHQTAFTASGLDHRGHRVDVADIRWSTLHSPIAQITPEGRVTAIAPGVARLVAEAGSVRDTAVVAVLGAESLLLTALPGGSAKERVKPGQSISIPVLLDLSRVSAAGDLGSLQFDLAYDSALLELVTATVAVAGSAVARVVAPGRIRFAFAATEPQGTSQLVLATLAFQVSSRAAPGAEQRFKISYTGQPTSTGFEQYEVPITIEGAVLVVHP